MNIREELNKLDQNTFNQYDLFNLYSSVSVDKELKEQVVGLIKENKCEELCKLLSEAYEKQTGISLHEEAYDNLPEIEDKVKGVTDQVTAKAVKDHEEKQKNIEKELEAADAEIKDEPFTSGEHQPKPEEPIVPDLIEEDLKEETVDTGHYDLWDNEPYTKKQLLYDLNSDKMLEKSKGSFQVGHPDERDLCAEILSDAGYEYEISGDGPWFHFEYWKEENESLKESVEDDYEKAKAALAALGLDLPKDIYNIILNRNGKKSDMEMPQGESLKESKKLNESDEDIYSYIQQLQDEYNFDSAESMIDFLDDDLPELEDDFQTDVEAAIEQYFEDLEDSSDKPLTEFDNDLEKYTKSFIDDPEKVSVKTLNNTFESYGVNFNSNTFSDGVPVLKYFDRRPEWREASIPAGTKYILITDWPEDTAYFKTEDGWVQIEYSELEDNGEPSLEDLEDTNESLKEELNQEDSDVESIYKKIANLKDYLKEADDIITTYHSIENHISDDVKLTPKEKQEKLKELEAEYKKHLEGFLHRLNYQKDKLIESLDEDEFSDFNSEFYNKLVDLLFKYHLKGKDIEREDVEKAYAWFDAHFYESDDNPGIEESLDEASTSVIPAPFNKYYKIDKEGELDDPEIVGSEMEDYDCKILHLLIAKKPFENLLDAPYAVLTDLPDYPVCELVGGSLMPVYVK